MATREERIQRVKRKALENDMNYSGCSQSVLGALQEEFGIGSPESFRAAAMLSGGIARQGETCGAIIGALSALGLLIGRQKIQDSDIYRNGMPPATQLRARFMTELQKQFGLEKEVTSTLCHHIQEMIYGRPFDFNKQADYDAFLVAGGHTEAGCPKVCAVAAQVAAEKILGLQS
ncbi:MAG: C-GCAxxG-C-C family protein [Dehalococcoidales bacterium]|nr:C-GCAxxG-C-C family protein [Dehalococcoidales bacterium]